MFKVDNQQPVRPYARTNPKGSLVVGVKSTYPKGLLVVGVKGDVYAYGTSSSAHHDEVKPGSISNDNLPDARNSDTSTSESFKSVTTASEDCGQSVIARFTPEKQLQASSTVGSSITDVDETSSNALTEDDANHIVQDCKSNLTKSENSLPKCTQVTENGTIRGTQFISVAQVDVTKQNLLKFQTQNTKQTYRINQKSTGFRKKYRYRFSQKQSEMYRLSHSPETDDEDETDEDMDAQPMIVKAEKLDDDESPPFLHLPIASSTDDANGASSVSALQDESKTGIESSDVFKVVAETDDAIEMCETESSTLADFKLPCVSTNAEVVVTDSVTCPPNSTAGTVYSLASLYKYSCSKCHRRFAQMQGVTNHCCLPDRTCSVCRKIFFSKNDLTKHLLIHFPQGERKLKNGQWSMVKKPKQVVSCDGCGKQFINRGSFRKHTCVTELTCPFCNKVFGRIGEYKIHMTVHTGAKPYSCHLCDKSFAVRDRLKKHLTTHIS